MYGFIVSHTCIYVLMLQVQMANARPLPPNAAGTNPPPLSLSPSPPLLSLLGVGHNLSHDPKGRVLPCSLHPAVGVVEDRERPLTVTNLKLVLLLHHLN